jgi:hypothetical protein
MEMTLHDLDVGKGIDHEDFLARADILGRLGLNVLISRFELYYQLAEYVVGFTDGLIGIAVGLPGLRGIASEGLADELAGGILESTGRLFKRSVKMYVHPTRDSATGEIREVGTAALPHPWHYFRDLLLETGHLVPIRDYEADFLSISSPDVLARIRARERAGSSSCRRRWRTRSWREGCSGIAGECESVDSAPRRLYPCSRAMYMTGEGSR